MARSPGFSWWSRRSSSLWASAVNVLHSAEERGGGTTGSCYYQLREAARAGKLTGLDWTGGLSRAGGRSGE